LPIGKIDNFAIIFAMRICVLALDGVFDIGLSALLDTFGTANEVAETATDVSTRFEVAVIGVRRHVKTSLGLSVPVRSTTDVARPDVLLVPALGAKMPPTLCAALARRDVMDAGLLLRQWAAEGVLVGAACTSTFILAGTALLDGQRATTTWWLASLFRQRYPRVTLDESRMLVESDCFVTAGAALAHLDLALSFVRRSSPALAALTARYLVVDPHPSQAAFMIPDQLAHADPLVEQFELWARRQLADGFSLTNAAKSIGVSERTLARRVHQVLGKSPLAYFQDLRVERAVHLLQTSDASVDQIAAQVGYADGVTLRTLLRRKIGRGVRELRGRI